MLAEPRSVTDIMRDLLSELQGREWVETRRSKGCNCCPDTWETTCTSCGAEAGDYGDETYKTHKPGCRLAAIILEAETFIRIEEQLAEEMDDGLVLPPPEVRQLGPIRVISRVEARPVELEDEDA